MSINQIIKQWSNSLRDSYHKMISIYELNNGKTKGTVIDVNPITNHDFLNMLLKGTVPNKQIDFDDNHELPDYLTIENRFGNKICLTTPIAPDDSKKVYQRYIIGDKYPTK